MLRTPVSAHAAALTPSAIAAWGDLLDRAEAFRDLAPWRWIDGASILGVRDPHSGDVDWCSIMGQGAETFGVAIYPGDDGLASLQRLRVSAHDEFDAMIAQVALVLTFNDRGMVTPDMVAVLKACRRRYRGANAWPELLAHEPGFFPLPPPEIKRIERAARAIDALGSMCVKAAAVPGWDRHDAQGRPWVVTPERGKPVVGREAMPAIPERPPPAVPIDEVGVARVLAQGRRAGHAVILEWFAGCAVITGPEAKGRPYFAVHVLAIDAHTGAILDVQLCTLAEAWRTMAGLLLKACGSLGIPAQLLVRRPEAVAVLTPIAQTLGIQLHHRPDLIERMRTLRDQMEAIEARHR